MQLIEVLRNAARWLRLPILVLAAFAAHAAPPSFTGGVASSNGTSAVLNLRAQGTITGTAPLDVRVTNVRVGGVLSPLLSIVRALVPGVNNTVCVQVTNLLGLDLSFLGVEMDVVVTNAEAPGGISGTVTVRSGAASGDTSPQACADAAVLAPVANAGPDQNLADTDRIAGENVTLSGAASQILTVRSLLISGSTARARCLQTASIPPFVSPMAISRSHCASPITAALRHQIPCP